MLVSVIVPVYNVAPYLDECLESICSQTYNKLEIIVIDDGSTDGSGITCDKWRDKDPRIQVIHQKNSGVSNARNAGLSVCTGDVISFVDSDDWLEPDMIEKLVECLIDNQADSAMCGYIDYPHGAPVKKGLFSVPTCDFSGAVYQMIRRDGYFTSLWAKVFKRELVFRDNHFQPFDPSLDYGEDEVWLLQVLRFSERVAFVPEALYFWRPREGSVTRTETITEKRLSNLNAKRKTLSLLPDDAFIRRISRGRIYNGFFSLKVQAYCTGNKDAFQMISKEIRPMLWDWIRSPEVVPLRKCKVLIVEMQILFRLPTALVKKSFALTHRKENT